MQNAKCKMKKENGKMQNVECDQFVENPQSAIRNPQSPLLRIAHLVKQFGGLRAVSDVSFDVAEGRIKAVIGPNGAGKTTIFNLVTGADVPTAGDVAFEGKRITGLKPHQIAAMGLSRTFQNVQLFDHMSVLENVMVGRHTRTVSGMLSAAFRLPKTRAEEKAIREAAMERLVFVGLDAQAGELATNLAFGGQRTLEFARALATEPKLLLLDEPASGLNAHETTVLAELILKIREQGVTVLLVEHDMELVMDISDEVVVLNYGEKIADGKPEAVQNDERVVAAYLGEE